ncbi:MAG: hypothetical protein GX335_08590 [Firmicutes bacterium]|nr:hypothetical protein [Bacillota bacterium]
MKLLITIVQDQDVPNLLEALAEEEFGATRLSSTGGFLRTGNTTLLIGVAKEKLDQVLDLIKKVCKKREQAPSSALLPFGKARGSGLRKVVVGGAIIFMVEIERFEKI